jgi:hypothetical protein
MIPMPHRTGDIEGFDESEIGWEVRKIEHLESALDEMKTALVEALTRAEQAEWELVGARIDLKNLEEELA